MRGTIFLSRGLLTLVSQEVHFKFQKFFTFLETLNNFESNSEVKKGFFFRKLSLVSSLFRRFLIGKIRND